MTTPEQALAEGFALQVERWALAGTADAPLANWLRQAAQALSLAIGEGHVCLPLAELAGDEWPELPALRRALHACGVVGTPQTPGARPLILDDEDRLYLHRHFDYERRLARRLMRAARAAPTTVDTATQ